MRLLVALPIALSVFLSTTSSACELGIYTYDGIAGKDGLGPQIFPEFERRTGCKLRVITAGDAIHVLGRVEIDLKRGKPAGDVVLGVDNLMWTRVGPIADHGLASDPLIDPINQKRIEPVIDAAMPAFPGFMPYDFGALAFVADGDQLAKSEASLPKTLSDLLKPEWQRNFILEDPRTSTPGLQFVLFTKRLLGNQFKEFWKSMRGRWLAMPSGWDAAYSLFLKGKAPLVWSYVTSEAYHREHGSTRYRAVLFSEGQPLQIEGAVMLSGARHPATARKFLRFLISAYVQERVGRANWMWPVRTQMTVPPSFALIPKVENGIVISGSDSETVLKEWIEAIHE